MQYSLNCGDVEKVILTDIAYFIYLFIYLFIIKLCSGLLSSLGLTITYILGHCWLLSRVTCASMQSAILLYPVCLSVRPSVRLSITWGMVLKRMHTLGVFGAGVSFAPWRPLANPNHNSNPNPNLNRKILKDIQLRVLPRSTRTESVSILLYIVTCHAQNVFGMVSY